MFFLRLRVLTLKYIPIWNVFALNTSPNQPEIWFSAVQCRNRYNNADSILRRFAILMSFCCCCSVFRFKNAIVAWMEEISKGHTGTEKMKSKKYDYPAVGPCEYVKGEVQRNASSTFCLRLVLLVLERYVELSGRTRP